jgi:uncharacterized protein
MTNPLRALHPVTLHEALQDAKLSLEEIKPLVHPSLINTKNPLDESPLKLACGNHAPDVIECVIDAGADINEPMGIYRYTALQVAAGAGYLALVERLIGDKADLDAQARDGRTALYEATVNEQKETAKVLMAAGAKLHLYDEHGWMPLHVAAAKGNEDLVEALLAFLYQSPEQLNAKTRTGFTPLYLACEKGIPAVVKQLLNTQVDVNSVNGQNHETALHLVTRKNNIPLLRLLLEKKPIVDARTQTGYTSLFLAYLHGYIDASRILIAAGADVNAVCGREAETPLYPAIRSRRPGLVGELLANKAQVHVQNHSKATPLEVACESDNYDAAEALISAKAEVRLQAVQAAVKSASKHMLTLLLEHFSQKNLLREGPALLYLACMRGDPEILAILLDAGLDANTKCGLIGVMQTPLHWAAMKGNVALIQLLLQRKAKFIKIKDKTPFDLAQAHGHTEAARVLMLHK